MDYTVLIDHYGYLVLFIALMLELIIFGIPTELLMGYAGFLVYQGKLNWILAILAAGTGTSLGITLSYFIGGKLGFPFFKKYGHKVHMGPERLDNSIHGLINLEMALFLSLTLFQESAMLQVIFLGLRNWNCVNSCHSLILGPFYGFLLLFLWVKHWDLNGKLFMNNLKSI